MNLLTRYRLRLERKKLLLRAMRKRQSLKVSADRTDQIGPDDILLFATLRNERTRLPYFLDYYRRLGVGHFLIVDNGSTDGSDDIVQDQKDCSLWRTDGSYKKARFGMDWINALLSRHGVGHWALVVDTDEFLVYPYMDTRPLSALTDWLDAGNVKSFGTLLIDMYPEGPTGETAYSEGQDPFEILTHFDSGNYVVNRNPMYNHLWIQGGPRQRVVFDDAPARAPALNKIPLLKWQKGAVYVSSTHHLLPRGLNRVYEEWGGEKVSGCLLHAKFLDSLGTKVTEELERRQHYAASREYLAYAETLGGGIRFDTDHSTRYEDWRQLDALGLMSFGGWA